MKKHNYDLFGKHPGRGRLGMLLCFLIFFFSAIETNAQARKISGKVLDEQSLPLIGATVINMRDKSGVITDSDGNFSLTGQEGDALQVSFIGMKSTEVVYVGEFITITMQLSDEQIDEIVISTTGYQSFDARNMTSSITTLKAKDVQIPGVTTIDNMLEGRVPGMMLMQNSGQVGAAPKLRIRGTSTVLGNREPLWVLDGIPLIDPVPVDPQRLNDLDFVTLLGNAISGINPEDIEQIDVLKDASATALYGTKAANGVIVITTKKGRMGPPTVSYSTSLTFTRRPHYTDKSINLMNSKERVDFSREIIMKNIDYRNDANLSIGYEAAVKQYYEGLLTYDQFKAQADYYETINTDWFDLLTQNEFSQSHTASLSGGNANFRYYTSLGYSDQGGVIKEESNRRYNVASNLTGNFKRFSFNFGLNASQSNRTYNPENLDVLNYAYGTSRAIPAINDDGSPLFYMRSEGGKAYRFNMLHEMANSSNKNEINSVNMNLNLRYQLNDVFKLSQTFAYNINQSLLRTEFGENTYYASNLREAELGDEQDPFYSTLPIGGELSRQTVNSHSYLSRSQMDANWYVDQDSRNHLITGIAGFEMQSIKYDSFAQVHRGYLPDRGRTFASIDMETWSGYRNWYENTPAAKGVIIDNIQNTMSGYLSLSYAYKNLYTLNVNARADASNKFGDQTNNKILPVWSASGRWNMKGNVLRNTDWIDLFSLRSSFGYQGNMLPDVSPELILRKGGYNNQFESYESSIERFPNPDLRWEKTSSYSAALDFAFFKNRLRGSIGYFYKDTQDAFLNRTVSTINGVTSYVTNTGHVTNKGLELSLDFTPISKSLGGGEIFFWRVNPQLGRVINTLLSKAVNNNSIDPSNGEQVYSYSDYINGNAFVAGRPLNSLYSYQFDGLNPMNGMPLFKYLDESLAEGYSKEDIEAVLMKVMSYSGSRVPVLQGSIINTIGYKRMTLNLNLTYSLGSKVRLFKLYESIDARSNAPDPLTNVRAEFVDRWQKPGDELHTNIPGIQTGNDYNASLYPWWLFPVDGVSVPLGGNLWNLYDNSDVRVVSGDYLRLSNVSFSYMLGDQLCKQVGVKSINVGVSATNLFTLQHKELNGQDPSQSGTANQINLSIRPTVSFNLNVNF